MMEPQVEQQVKQHVDQQAPRKPQADGAPTDGTAGLHSGRDKRRNDRLQQWLHPAQGALPVEPDSNVAGAVRTGLLFLALGFGGFLLWSVLVPLDEAVPAQGVVTIESKRKRIDHLYGGLVEKVLVREGQRVKAGQELLLLNEVQGKASLNAALSQWRTAAASVARLEAERDELASVRYPQRLAVSPDEETRRIVRAQDELLRSRRQARDGELRIVRESMRGLQGQLGSLEQLLQGRERQVELFKSQLAAFQKLNKQGFVSPNQLLDLERQMAEIQSKQSEDMANMGGIKARLAEFRMRDSQIMLDYRRDVDTQLTAMRRDEATLAERLTATNDSFERLSVRAPMDGTVVDLAPTTVGSVIKAGERVMDIVPEREDLVVEARVAPHYVDQLRGGLPAHVHLDGYVSFIRRPVLKGTVTTVSADSVMDARSGLSYYTLRVAVPAGERERLKEATLQPGMPVSVMVKTGERSLMAYLLGPVVRRLGSALSEH